MRWQLALALLLFASGLRPGTASGEFDGAATNEGTQQRRELLVGRPHTVLDGESNDETNKIVGGTPTNGQEFPFYVQADTEVSGYYCGGSLMADDMVLSAAHCLGR